MKLFFLFPFSFCLVLLTDCSALDRALLKPQVTTIPPQIISTNLVFLTNTVTFPASTNAAGIVTPPTTNVTVQPNLTFTYSPPVTTTNWVVNPTIQTGLGFAGSLPVPYAGLGAIAAVGC